MRKQTEQVEEYVSIVLIILLEDSVKPAQTTSTKDQTDNKVILMCAKVCAI